MHLKYRGVNEAFYGLVSLIHQGDIPVVKRNSRVGEVLQIEEPMIITYSHPRERVLLSQARDQNVFFTLFESLWMLAGRSDIAPLEYYSSNYRKQVQDKIPFEASAPSDQLMDDPFANGAYGHRWRKGHGKVRGPRSVDTDQLKILIDHLRNKPESRRAVLQMWDVEDDLLKIDSSKDVVCNLSVCFAIRTKGILEEGRDVFPVPFLDMTVFNRSNDLVWGALGANAVHFSFLQEYLANCLGVEVGVYNQVSNNLHVYTNNWKPEEWLAEIKGRTQLSEPFLRYENGTIEASPIRLVQDQKRFDEEVAEFVTQYGPVDEEVHPRYWEEPFLRDVAEGMCLAFYFHKKRLYQEAFDAIEGVEVIDWRTAGKNWLEKRRINYERKQDASK